MYIKKTIMCVCLFVFIYPSAYLPICLFFCLSMFMHTFIYLSVYIWISLSFCLFTFLHVCIYQYTCLSVYLSRPLSVWIIICLPVFLVICLSICLGIYLFIYLPVSTYPRIYPYIKTDIPFFAHHRPVTPTEAPENTCYTKSLRVTVLLPDIPTLLSSCLRGISQSRKFLDTSFPFR